MAPVDVLGAEVLATVPVGLVVFGAVLLGALSVVDCVPEPEVAVPDVEVVLDGGGVLVVVGGGVVGGLEQLLVEPRQSAAQALGTQHQPTDPLVRRSPGFGSRPRGRRTS